MLTQQESLEAMAGRSPDGKPLIFVSQGDYDALRMKYEELLKASKEQKFSRRWRAALATLIATAVIAVSAVVVLHPDASAQVEPFGKYFYAANDVVGVHAANAFCIARKEERQMHPGNVLGASGLVFDCVKSADEVAADRRAAVTREAEPWQFTPPAENRARCIELRDQLKQGRQTVKEQVTTRCCLRQLG